MLVYLVVLLLKWTLLLLSKSVYANGNTLNTRREVIKDPIMPNLRSPLSTFTTNQFLKEGRKLFGGEGNYDSLENSPYITTQEELSKIKTLKEKLKVWSTQQDKESKYTTENRRGFYPKARDTKKSNSYTSFKTCPHVEKAKWRQIECKFAGRSNCWKVGTFDLTCPNTGLCCFDGCFNRCLDIPKEKSTLQNHKLKQQATHAKRLGNKTKISGKYGSNNKSTNFLYQSRNGFKRLPKHSNLKHGKNEYMFEIEDDVEHIHVPLETLEEDMVRHNHDVEYEKHEFQALHPGKFGNYFTDNGEHDLGFIKKHDLFNINGVSSDASKGAYHEDVDIDHYVDMTNEYVGAVLSYTLKDEEMYSADEYEYFGTSKVDKYTQVPTDFEPNRSRYDNQDPRLFQTFGVRQHQQSLPLKDNYKNNSPVVIMHIYGQLSRGVDTSYDQYRDLNPYKNDWESQKQENRYTDINVNAKRRNSYGMRNTFHVF